MNAVMNGVARPPLKWAGGKRWLLPYLRPVWDQYQDHRLVEPLCGGLSVALGLSPQKALLNDINPHVVNFYQWLQAGFKIKIKMQNDSDLYYAHRQRFNTLIAKGSAETKTAAALFYYLNRTGYNGLCRFNQHGEFNVPFGSYAKITYRRDFTDYQSALAGWRFTCRDFAEIRLGKKDFIYADPPYDVEFTAYTKTGFRWDDQQRLTAWLVRHEGPVVLSNQATKRVLQLYEESGFTCQIVDAPRRISCTGDRTPAKEVIATRNIAAWKYPNGQLTH